MTRFHRSGPLYVPSGMGKLTLAVQGVSPTVPMPTYVPTSQEELSGWIDEQTDVWSRPEVQGMIRDTQGQLQEAVNKEIPYSDQLTVDPDTSYTQMLAHVAVHGYPTTPDEAVDMAWAYLDQQGQQMGFHPALLNAVGFIKDWPDTPEEAADRLKDVAINIGQQYGLPIPTDMSAKSMVAASACAVMTTAGIPGVGVVTTTISALWDGKLDEDEIKGIVTAVGAAVGAAIGQYFGIPAPVGAFVGGLVTGVIYDWLGFGESADELRGKAWNAMLKAKAAMEAQCLQMATEAWDAYNAYWNELITNLQGILNEQAPYMGDGLRYFGDVGLIALPKDIKMPFGKKSLHYFEPVPFPVARGCEVESGCLYYDEPNPAGAWIRIPGASPKTRDTAPNVTKTGHPARGSWHVSSQGTYLSAYLALAFWNARRFVTPFHGMLEYFGIADGNWLGDGATKCWSGGRTSGSYVQCWFDTPHTDREYLQYLSRVRSALRPEDLEMCKVPEWSQYMIRSLDQAGPAQGLVSRNINQTVAALAAEQNVQAQRAAIAASAFQDSEASALQYYGEGFASAAETYVSQQQIARVMTAQVAQARRDLLRERRAKASMEAQLNAGLFMSGVGALAGWAAAEILGRR